MDSMLNEVESDGADVSVIANTAGVRPSSDFSKEHLQEYAILVSKTSSRMKLQKLSMKISIKACLTNPELEHY